ncbi:NfeD family protein [Clostridium sp. SYSU_GA19001]|uniref:NfeD family protein n=1 Tax=Clostridium caldaquaticum TaxID=2940653 RepID=UPI0020779071|nr:NfeD family protein [Clostridium caldaquaticum]MCM8710335.1 NfeD family protein [Clostridium caldaquaticum]
MEQVYTIVFWVGVIYTVVTFLLGGLLGLFHMDGHVDTHVDTNFHASLDSHIDTHADSGISPTFAVFPLKPITIVSFLTVFGGIGIIGTHSKINPILLFIIAFISALITAFILYRFIVIPLYKAQNTSAFSKNSVVGMKAKVISPILEGSFGTISYVVNGKRYNGPAQHVGKKGIPQGEEVIIYEIKNNVFYVEPLNYEK